MPPLKDKGKLPLFWGNGEQVIPIYAYLWFQYECNNIHVFNVLYLSLGLIDFVSLVVFDLSPKYDIAAAFLLIY